MTTATPESSAEIQPYPGLRPFREDETHLYFGRERHRAELLKRLAATRFVAVIGTSGSGKSSLVRAGLLPDLLSGYLKGSGSEWVIVESKPGTDPLGHLVAAFVAGGWPVDATALRTNSSEILELAGRWLGTGQHLLVLVDQFEELFRLKTSDDPAADADEKAAFVRLLLNAGGQRADVAPQESNVHIVMAMRSEFLGRASVYRGLPEAIDQGQYLIPRLSRAELRKAIESPARVAGGELEESLVQRLLNELGDDQDQLPVLQHALMRCWQLRDGADGVGIEAYKKSGQLANALSQDANEGLAEARAALSVRGEPIVMRVFQALRETDVNGGQTRRPTTVQDARELAGCTIEELTVALLPFRRRSFVLPPSDIPLEGSTLLDISHEALLRRWDMLRKWIEEDDQDRTRYLRLARRAAEELGSERPQYFVPPLLDLLLKFWADRNPSKAWAVRHHPGYEGAKAFLDESERHWRDVEQAEASRQAEESRQKHALADAVAKRTMTRLRASALVGLLVLIAAAAGFAWRSALAQGRQLEGLAIGAKLASTSEANVEARLQLAAEAADRQQAPEAWHELLKALFVAPTPRKAGWGDTLPRNVTSVAISPGDEWLYAVAEQRLLIVDLATGQERLSMPMSEYRKPGEDEDPILLTAGGKLLMSANGFAVVIDGSTLRLLAEPIPATAFTASADGSWVAFLASDSVTLCDLRSNCSTRVRHDVKGLSASDLEISGDGTMLVLVGRGKDEKRQLALFNTMDWKERKVRGIESSSALALSVDRDHVHLCAPEAISQYDAYDDSLDEKVIRQLSPEAESCRFFGERIVSSHADGSIRVWDETGTLVSQAQAVGRVKQSWTMAFGDRTLVAVSDRMEAWDVLSYGRQAVANPLGFFKSNGYAFTERGLVELDTGTITAQPDFGLGPRKLVALSDSMKHAVLRAENQRDAVLVTLRPGEPFLPIWPKPDDAVRPIRSVVLSPDERQAAINFDSGALILPLDGTGGRHEVPEGSVLFAPIGRDALILNGSKAEVLSLDDNKKRLDRDFQSEAESLDAAAFTSDGRSLALAITPKETAERPRSRGQNAVVEVFAWPNLERSTGQELRHSARVTGMSFRPDGQALLTITADGTIHNWDLASGTEKFWISPQGRSNGAVFTPGGRIAILEETGLRVLPGDTTEFLREPCRRIQRNLTRKEWEDLLGGSITYKTTCPDLPSD